MENNLRGAKTWNEILKPADKVAAPFIGMAVGVKSRNPQSTHTTTTILKTKSGGRKSSLTDERITVKQKSNFRNTISQKSKFRKSSTSQYGLSSHSKTYRKPFCNGKREKQLDQHKRFFDKKKEKGNKTLEE